MAHQSDVPNYMWQRIDGKLLLLLMLGLVGALTILYSTKWGIGIGSDSVGYLGGAESLLRGQGYSHLTGMGDLKPTNQWPPLYSVALTPLGFVGLGIPEAARWLNALLFGINISLVGYIVYRQTAFWPAVIASVLILSSVGLIRLHAMAYSEPLYFFLGLTGLYFLDKYINTSKTYPLIISALLIGAATLTRNIGVTLIVTLCMSILIFSKRSLIHRLVDCFIAGAISSLLYLLFVIRNVFVLDQLVVYKMPPARLMTAGQISEGLNTISLWFLPDNLSFGSRELILVAVVLVMLVTMAWFRSIASSFWWLNVIYVFVYCLGLSLAIIFLDPRIPYDFRYLSPVLVSVVIILTLAIYRISLRAGRWVGTGVSVFCVLFLLSYVQRSVLVVKDIRQNGQGWEKPVWSKSKIISLVKNLPGDVWIYSTNPNPMRFLSHRNMRELPWKFDQYTLKPSPDYFRTIEEIGATSPNQRILILYVNGQPPAFMSVADLKKDLTFKEIETEPQGSLFEVFH